MAEAKPEVKRLCSEIQLFDLCERERCTFKDGRYCTEPALLARFEALSEPEDRMPDQYLDDEYEEGDELEYSDGVDDDDYDDEE